MNTTELIDLVVEYGVVSIFTMCAAIQLFYYWFFYARTAFKKFPEREKLFLPPISVIISARNEAENLQNFLPSILEQEYPDFEVVVVNDGSTDETEIILSDFKVKYPHLKITFLHNDLKFMHGKKLALTIGIKAAKNENLLFTDADCQAQSNQWLKSMAPHFNKNGIVLGYGGYFFEKSFLNNLIRFDTFFIALQYLGFSLAGKTYMGVGRNLGYKKSLYTENKGFASHNKLVSGDDDLFVNETSGKTTTAVEYTHDSHTRSIPEKSFKFWSRQKKRHFSTTRYYKTQHKILLGLELFSRMVFYITLVWLLIVQTFLIFTLSVLFTRMLSQLIIFNSAIKRLNEKNLLLTSFLHDIILPMLYLIFSFTQAFSRKNTKWR